MHAVKQMQPGKDILGGPAQDWSADLYARHGGFVPVLGKDVLDLLHAKQGERILDVGCGDGVLTAQIKAAGATVIGIDASPDLINAAQAKGLDARLLDAHRLAEAAATLGTYDAAFSNAALHWMADLGKVLAGIYSVLAPGGRLVAEMGGHGNVASVSRLLHTALSARGLDPQAIDPWVFPSPEEITSLLEGCGFKVQAVSLFQRPTQLPEGIRGWLQTFGNVFLDAVPSDEDRAAILDEVSSAWEAEHQVNEESLLDYVRLRFSAVKMSAQ